MGWPDFSALCSMGKRGDFLWGPILHSGNLRGLSAAHGRRPGENLDPLARASHSAGAIPAEVYAFRRMGADFHMECPLVGRAFKVWARPEGFVRFPD